MPFINVSGPRAGGEEGVKRVKPSEHGDKMKSGVMSDADGHPSFGHRVPNRRVGKLWQRTMIRYWNSKPSRPAGPDGSKAGQPPEVR